MFHRDSKMALVEIRANSDTSGVRDSKAVNAHSSSNSFRHPFCPERTIRKFSPFHYPVVYPTNWRSELDTTSSEFSTFDVVNRKSNYRICDELELRIQARNGRNEMKTHGGDYFRAKIYTITSNFKTSSSQDGQIIDNGDGSYSAFFTFKWSGMVRIYVGLVHSSEAVYVLDRLRANHQPRQVYLGTFSRPGEEEEVVYCNSLPRPSMKESDLCNFTDKRTGSPWYCEKPARFECTDRVMHRLDAVKSNEESVSLMSEKEQAAFGHWVYPVTGSTAQVHVAQRNSSDDLRNLANSFPICSPGISKIQPQIAGYYSNGTWIPSNCKVHRFSTAEHIRSCLQNKHVYFFGDSTIRQLSMFYIDKLKLTKTIYSIDQADYTGPLTGSDSIWNISTFYAFHGFPISKNAWTHISDIEYVANRIDQINNNESTVVVVVSLWAHFTSCKPTLLEQRLHGILAAMRRLHERNPRAVLVLKGANTREGYHFVMYACCSDWYARDLEYRIRFALEHFPLKIGYLNAWQMTEAQLEYDNVHPTGTHVENLSDQLLTMLGCSM
ncbi:NXPE family member 3-like isoform X1 [Diadema antillarum]